MEVRILGPLEVRAGNGALALGGAKARALLAVLALHANRPVSAEQLTLALWGDEAPPGAVKALQVHVSRLRKALGDTGVLETTPAGYRLLVEVDADRFERELATGREALATGDVERAASLLRDALALWRGPPLAGLEFAPFAQDEIRRLEEQRLAALEARVEADLRAGRHAAVVSELRALLAEDPARERFASQLMLALYRSGHQAEALDVYRRTRDALVDRLGIEPGPELRRLHAAVLAQDPSLELSASARELPAPLDAQRAPRLAGRDAPLALLREHWRAARAGRGRVVTVCGPDGIGKTRLAAELAGEAFRAGGAVAYLTGADPAAAAALGGLLPALRPTLAVLDDADGAPAELRSALAEPALAGSSVLVLVCAQEQDGLVSDDTVVLGPLDPQAVSALAADRRVPAEALLASGDGVPRHLHRLASRWAEREAARRVDTAAERAAASRAALQSVEADLAGGVVELQAAREDAALAEDEDGLVGCPFKGLASFDVADAPYFFGRERVVAELVARLVGAPLLGVVGPSGSGKSSVVRAGLLPALAHGVLPGSADWEQVVMRPGEHPLRELAEATARVRDGRRLVLLVDQFEETFTVCRDERERSAFVGKLIAAGTRSGVAVLAIRADHYGRCGAYPELSRRLAVHQVLISAMRRDELRRAVERPAQRAGLHVEPGLTDALVDDVEHEPGALPMLSAALLELWQRRDGRRLRLSTYEATGGVRGAVARHAEAAFGRLDRHQQALARVVLLRLATEDAGGTIERRRIPLTELDGDVADVVAVLTDQRLLTVSAGAVELAHEALLREWPRLRGWLEEDADGRRVHRRLAGAAREWDEAGRDPGDLYRGARLAGVLEWRARHAGELNRTERAFVDAARTAEARERGRRRRAVALGIAALIAVTGISTVLAIRGIERTRRAERAAASRTLATQAEARLPDNIALAGLLALEADRREPTADAQSAVLSVLQALAGDRRVGPPLRNGTPLERVAFSPDGRTLVAAGDDGTISWWDASARRRLRAPVAAHDGAVKAVAFSPDGRRLASGGEDGTIRLWDAATGRPIGRPLRFESRFVVDDVAFSPNGAILAASGSGGPSFFAGSGPWGRVRLWDARTGRPLGAPLRAAAAGARAPGNFATVHLNPIAFSPDGRRLAASLDDATVQMWDLPSRRPIEVLHLPASEQVETLAFSPDGSRLATGGTDQIIRLWDVRTGRQQGARGGPAGQVNSLAFSPDGRMLAVGSDDGSVGLGTVAGLRPLAVLYRATDSPRGEAFGAGTVVSSVAFNPRGGTLASADDGGAVQLWAVEEGRALSGAIAGHRGPVHGLAYPAAGTLASAGSDGRLQLWDVHARRALGGPVRMAGPVNAIAPSPDGRTLAVAGAHGMLQVWDARARRPIRPPLRGFTGDVNAVAFSSDGDTLAAGGADGTVRLWSARTWDPAGPPLDAHAALNSLAFGRDGKVLAAAGQDGTVRLWDVGHHRALGEPLRGPAGFLAAVAFSPDGKILAAAGADKSVWLWDAGTRGSLGPPLTGHTDVLHALAFSPDGRTLASAGADHTVRLWDVAARRPLGRPLDHGSWVTGLAFDPDGTSLASAGNDGTIRLWDPILWSHDRHALARRVCGAVRRNLTRAEWARYIPDQPYHRTCAY